MRLGVLVIVLISFLISCVKTTTLRSGYEKVPANAKAFKNKMHFDRVILAQIDTAVIYEEYGASYYAGNKKQPPVLARLNYKNPNTIYTAYRFYGNGNYNVFVLDRNAQKLTREMFDPAYNGWRGVLYKKKEKINGDLFTQVGQLQRQLGFTTNEFIVRGDTLIVKSKNAPEQIYIKRYIDKELLNHTAEW